LYNEKLHNLYSSDITRMMKWICMKYEGHVAYMAEMRNAYKILV